MPKITLKTLAYSCNPSILHPFFKQIEASDIGSRLVRGVFWSVAGTVISRGLMLVATVVVARLLGKTGYGELGMVQSTVGMLGTFAGFGLGLTATKYVAEYRSAEPARAGRIIGLSGLIAMATGGVMATGLALFAPWLAEHTIKAPHLASVLRISALILFFSALNGAQIGALSGLEAFKTIAKVNLLAGLFSFPILICGAYFGGISGVAWALVVNLCLNWFLNHFALRTEARRHRVPVSFKHCNQEFSILWAFSIPAVLAGAMVGPVVWVCNTILVNQKGGYAALGSYSAAFLISVFISTVNSMIGQAFLPVCSSTLESAGKRFEYINIVFQWAVGIACALPFICLPELYAIFFGKAYFSQDMLRSVVLVSFSSIIVAHRQGIARNFVAKNFLWWSFFGNASWGGSAIICSYLLCRYGSQGIAASFAIAYTLNTIIFIPFYIKKNLCPKRILTSIYSIFVWIIILLLVIGSFMNLVFALRIVLMFFSYCLILLLLIKLWNTETSS